MKGAITWELYVNNGFMLVLALAAFFTCGFAGLWVDTALYLLVMVYGILNYLNIWSEVTFLMIFWTVVGGVLMIFVLLQFFKDIDKLFHICDEVSCDGITPELVYSSVFLGAFVLVTMFVNFIKLWELILLLFHRAKVHLLGRGVPPRTPAD